MGNRAAHEERLMLKIYNSLTRQKEEFKPLEEGKVGMYVCGMTVYDYCHIGHARTFIAFDVIYRYLKHVGYDVNYVRNYTDVDDKIIARANERGISCDDLTKEFIQYQIEDFTALGMEAPNVEPKATEHIKEMIDIIKGLEDKGIAYKAGDDVFYSVRDFEGYGKLSGKNVEELESGARIDIMDVKKDPLDFVLWKSAKPGEPKWESPWGDGRPGWHIECSAMSMRYLGKTFDIHGGGKDLVFPHHENEVAQSEACTTKDFAKVWMHSGHLNINSVKMSKSLDNFFTIRDLLKMFPAEVLRLFYISAHYRSPLDYTEKNMQDALSSLERFYTTKLRLEELAAAGEFSDSTNEDMKQRVQALKENFATAMNDDFNTAKVVGNVFEWVREVNRHLDEHGKVSKEIYEEAQAVLKDFGAVLGVFGSDAATYLSEMKTKGVAQSGVSESEIENAIQARKDARAGKDFAKADQIRDDLKAKGVILKDNPDGTTTWTLG